jgi:hypothetical protein
MKFARAQENRYAVSRVTAAVVFAILLQLLAVSARELMSGKVVTAAVPQSYGPPSYGSYGLPAYGGLDKASFHHGFVYSGLEKAPPLPHPGNGYAVALGSYGGLEKAPKETAKRFPG